MCMAATAAFSMSYTNAHCHMGFDILRFMCDLVLHGSVFVCVYGLRLYIPVNIFSVMSGWSHCFLDITSSILEVFAC